jgi:hypothetical protein
MTGHGTTDVRVDDLDGNLDTLETVAPHRDPEDSCAHRYRDLAAAVRDRGRTETRR